MEDVIYIKQCVMSLLSKPTTHSLLVSDSQGSLFHVDGAA